MRITLVVLIGLFGGGVGASALAQSDDQLHVVLPREAIPSIDRPSFEPAARTKSLAANELIIGIVGEHERRAYSTWQLDSHEIVNDTFEGRPITVTW